MAKTFKVNVQLSYSEAEKLLAAFHSGKLPMVKDIAVTKPKKARKAK